MNLLQELLLAAIVLFVLASILGVSAVNNAFAGPWNHNTLAALSLFCYGGAIISMLALAFVALGH